MNHHEEKPRILVLHGIGKQGENWLEEATLGMEVATRQRFTPVYWADILDESPHASGLLALGNVAEAALNSWARGNMMKGAGGWQQAAMVAGAALVAPLVKQMLNLAGDALGYASIRYRAFSRLNRIIEAAPGDVILIGHSLGSVLAFEFLCLGPNPQVKAFISLGSPLDRQPVKGRTLKRAHGKNKLITPWLNLWGTQDWVCCWMPWRSGALDAFQPAEQIRLAGHGHNLHGYLSAIPEEWLS